LAWQRASPPTAKAGDGKLLRALRRVRVSHVLLALNITVFLLQGAFGGGRLLVAGAKVNTGIAAGQLYRLFPHMFLHAIMSHLAVNSFPLYSTGQSVEAWFGHFASLYVVSGICGNSCRFSARPRCL
jgi:membrane associated rhomboid family serine protease